MGEPSFERQSAEKGSEVFRRSVYFIRDLKAGDLIQCSDIRRIRPGRGLAPKFFDDLIGRRVVRDVGRGDIVNWSDLQNK